jgi:PB1 domain
MSTGDNEGPAWNKFWMALENETESVMSGEGSARPPMTPDGRSLMSPDGRPTLPDRGDSVVPNDSASHHGIDSPEHSALTGARVDDVPFAFKFKAPSGRMHRLQVFGSSGIAELISQVAQKLGAEADAIGGIPEVEDGKIGKSGFALSYLDNEGDTVSITTDRDLLEATSLASQSGRDKVDLFIHDPEKAPLPATLDPHPTLPKSTTPPAPSLRERIPHESDGNDEEEEVAADRSRHGRRKHVFQHQPKQEQLIAGVPNDLLLPGAIVSLAVVIVGVFAISRATSR